MSPTAVIVDDSNTMRGRLKTELAKLGVAVVGEAAAGELVLSLYEQHHPALLFLDIVMPGLDGISAATQVLAKHPEATVVMCSSINARDKILACRTAGVKQFILKPFTSEKVAQVVQGLLGILPPLASSPARSPESVLPSLAPPATLAGVA